MGKDIISYCEVNIDRLEKHLDELYTIDCPEGYIESRCKNGKINVYKELEYLRELESIYNTFEELEVNQGELYERYNGYLQYIKQSKKDFEEKIKSIRNEYANDIQVAETLLMKFKQHLNTNKAFD